MKTTARVWYDRIAMEEPRFRAGQLWLFDNGVIRNVNLIVSCSDDDGYNTVTLYITRGRPGSGSSLADCCGYDLVSWFKKGVYILLEDVP